MSGSVGAKEQSVPDFDIYRIEELPKDELGGASGEKRRFRLEFIGLLEWSET